MSAIFYLYSGKNIFTAEQTFFHSRRTGIATSHVSARSEQHFSFAIRAHEALVNRRRWGDDFDVVSGKEKNRILVNIIFKNTEMYEVIVQEIVPGTSNLIKFAGNRASSHLIFRD